MTEDRQLTREVSFTVGGKITKATETVPVKIQWPGKFTRPDDASTGYVSFGGWVLAPLPAEPKPRRAAADPAAPQPPEDPEDAIQRGLSGDWPSVSSFLRDTYAAKSGPIGRADWNKLLGKILVGLGVDPEPAADFPATHSSMCRDIYNALAAGRVDGDTGKITE